MRVILGPTPCAGCGAPVVVVRRTVVLLCDPRLVITGRDTYAIAHTAPPAHTHTLADIGPLTPVDADGQRHRCPEPMRPTFTPQAVRRNRCALCGTLRHSHAEDGRCPEMYRPDSLEAARRQMARAVEAGDEAAIFVARGEVQRLGGRTDAVR